MAYGGGPSSNHVHRQGPPKGKRQRFIHSSLIHADHLISNQPNQGIQIDQQNGAQRSEKKKIETVLIDGWIEAYQLGTHGVALGK